MGPARQANATHTISICTSSLSILRVLVGIATLMAFTAAVSLQLTRRRKHSGGNVSEPPSEEVSCATQKTKRELRSADSVPAGSRISAPQRVSAFVAFTTTGDEVPLHIMKMTEGSEHPRGIVVRRRARPSSPLAELQTHSLLQCDCHRRSF